MVFLGVFSLLFLSILSENSMTAANHPPELKSVNYSGVSFFVGPIHHDWVLNHESHVLKEMHRSILEVTTANGTCTMLDVGANDGFYANMAGAMGCQVWGFEIQRRCMEIANAALAANKLNNQVTIFNMPVSNVNNDILILPHSATACDGLYSLGRTDCPQCPKRDEAHQYQKRTFHTVALDSFVPHQLVIDFIKIDTEGHEPEILEGAERLFKDHRIRNAVVESQPKMWMPRAEGTQDVIYEKILDYGYEISCTSHTFQGWPDKYTKDNKQEFITNLHTNRCVDWLMRLPKNL